MNIDIDAVIAAAELPGWPQLMIEEDECFACGAKHGPVFIQVRNRRICTLCAKGASDEAAKRLNGESCTHKIDRITKAGTEKR